MPETIFMAVSIVVGLLLFWGFNYFFRNQLAPAHEVHRPPDKSKVKRLLIMGALGSCAGWIMLGFVYWIQKK